jgi:hypothetical protein
VKFPMLVPCRRCGNELTIETTGDERYPDVQCSSCQLPIWIIDDGTVSSRVFCRAEVELGRDDWSLAIILSAMSVECELAYLYSKWKALDANLVPSEVKPIQVELWEEEFRKLGTISRRLDAVSDLLAGCTFDSFLALRPDVLSALSKTHPRLGTSSKDFFIKELFWTRNKILHSGKVQFGSSEAAACVKTAMTMIQIIRLIDRDRYLRLEEELKARRASGK